MKIAIVGAGNVAWHLAQALQKAGHQVVAICSKTIANARELASQLPNAVAIENLDFSNITIDIALISVPDAILANVAAQLKVQPNTIVAHTSGSQHMQALQSINGLNYGVFYPLQTFSKLKPVNFSQIPVLVEGNTEAATMQLEELAQTISGQVERVTSDKRKTLHLAAVFACNFTNHLLGISNELLQNADLPTDLLHPLIHETVAKATMHNPYQVQTGPAIRHDANVINEHIEFLATNPQLQAIYKLLTQSIQQQAAS